MCVFKLSFGVITELISNGNKEKDCKVGARKETLSKKR
uniref:Uncharacterized protein n=1 Tax=Rhizophora mucronata TaxID=61149 RepID=A0A2P2NDV1_RHIMU